MATDKTSGPNPNFPLSDTSALVLLWIGETFFTTPSAKTYLAKLDLAAGQPLYQACARVWPHYSEVILNRKFAIRHLAEAHCQPQIIIAGAGLDAMGLELAGLLDEVTVFELDFANMQAKQEMIDAVFDRSKVVCVSANLGNARQCLTALKKAGWRADRPSLLLLEGITYYLQPAQLADLVAALAPARVIGEILLPAADLSAEAARIADGVFGEVERACALPAVTRFSAAQLAQTLNLQLCDSWSMARIEHQRTGTKHYFTDAFQGWIEVAVLK